LLILKPSRFLVKETRQQWLTKLSQSALCGIRVCLSPELTEGADGVALLGHDMADKSQTVSVGLAVGVLQEELPTKFRTSVSG
jgi:hypothetical protein